MSEAAASPALRFAAGERSEPVNVLIVGVGGQGVILVSKVLARLAQQRGYQVKQSEVHGMAKRGGSVFSHVRYGREVWSPTIARGEVDLLIALEWAEALRWLPWLKPGCGLLVCDTKRIVPPFSCLNRRPGAPLRYARETPADVQAHVAEGHAVDATLIAEELGNERTANVVLLGAVAAALEFGHDEWESGLGEFVPAKTLAVNLEAFRRGREWIERARRGEEPALAPSAAPSVEPGVDVRLEIIRQWCKSCDICVKLCPERCLRLDQERIVELADPSKCTGCRLCEWLCPDFAIRVHVEPAMNPAATAGNAEGVRA